MLGVGSLELGNCFCCCLKNFMSHGGTHVSSCICSRGCPSQPSVGEKALGLVKVLCPSIGKCQDREAGVGGLVSTGRGNGVGGFRRGNEERG